jgi:hypothetical protein
MRLTVEQMHRWLIGAFDVLDLIKADGGPDLAELMKNGIELRFSTREMAALVSVVDNHGHAHTLCAIQCDPSSPDFGVVGLPEAIPQVSGHVH